MPPVEFMYLVFTCMLGEAESYRRRGISGLCCGVLRDIFRVLSNFFVSVCERTSVKMHCIENTFVIHGTGKCSACASQPQTFHRLGQ